MKCRKCDQDDKKKDGTCRPCKNAYAVKWRAANPDKAKAATLRYNKRKPDQHIRNRYGITQSQYDEMVKAQNGACPLCLKTKKLVVDHCHKTNRVRGLLCIGCNAALGAYEKLSALSERVKLYLG